MDGGTGGCGEPCSTREFPAWALLSDGGSDGGGADRGNGPDGEGGWVKEGLRKDLSTQIPSTGSMIAPSTSLSETARMNSMQGMSETPGLLPRTAPELLPGHNHSGEEHTKREADVCDTQVCMNMYIHVHPHVCMEDGRSIQLYRC